MTKLMQSQNKNKKENPKVNVKFTHEIMCNRLINTQIALGYAMKFYKENLKILRKLLTYGKI